MRQNDNRDGGTSPSIPSSPAMPSENDPRLLQPFFNILASDITKIVGEKNPQAVIATTLVAFSFSSILTGIIFFTLGELRLGAIIGIFPRPIFVGCIGGIGWFLIETG